jgi:glycosyltransferase involved in cell wall biosynthesis/GT2 family glycosyltransferase
MPPIVAFDADVIGRRRTGDESVATGLLTALAARDDLPFGVLAYVRDASRVPAAIAEGPGVRLVEVARGSNYLRTAVSLPMRLATDRPAVYHGNYILPRLPDAIAPPMVLTVHDCSCLSAPELMPRHDAEAFRRFVPWSARRAARVVTVSEFTRRDLLGLLPDLDPERVVAIPNGVGSAFRPDPGAVVAVRERFGIAEPYVLFVGALQPRKNLRRLLRAWAAVVADPRRDEQLLLVGPAKQEVDELHREIGELGLGARVRFLPYVDDPAELASLYAAARAFAFPSLYEGFGIPVAEAMACGTPVVAADATALPEVCGDAAVLVDPLDEGAIADGLRRVLDDDALRARLRDAGLARAAGYRWEDAAERLAGVYVDVLREAAPRRASARPVAGGRPVRAIAAVTSTGQAEDLGPCLGALQAEGLGDDLRIVVVCNLPGDGSVEVARAHGVEAIEQPEPRSVAENQATAFALGPSEHLLIVNPDTVPEPGAVRALLAFLDAHPEAGAVAPVLLNADGSYQAAARRFPEPIGGLWRRTPLRRLAPPGRVAPWHELAEPDGPRPIDWAMSAFLLVRRAAWDEVGGHDEGYRRVYVEEIDLQWRLWQGGWEVWQEPAARVLHAHQAVTDGAFLHRRTLWHLRNAGRFVRRHPTVLAGRSPGLAPSGRGDQPPATSR